MKTISPQVYASILILIRIFALSMYVPSSGENPAVTAVCAAAVSAVKLVSFIPLFIIFRRTDSPKSKAFAKCAAVFAAVVSAGYLLIINDAFSTVIESVYPDRFTKTGVCAVLFFIAAYVASMGINGVSRSAAICSFVFTAALLIIFIEMRSGMLNDRINLYSADIGKETARTCRNLLVFLGDYFVFAAMLPYLKCSPKKAAAMYITADVLISLVFFMMSASVMGSFFHKTGFSFYTLAYCTYGFMIDRSDGIFLAISTSCALICCAAMLMIMKNSLKFLFPVKSDNAAYLGCAAAAAAVSLSTAGSGINIAEQAGIFSAVTSAVIFISSAAGLIKVSIHKKRRSAK